ncbi:putative DSBA oxidoreductase [Magnetofaba australis IT-1]|uniref:Putative DSBA oxidoreductase n=1 Tax=Magnetofaba australis IT-1 TaxID=1434232 RepID=A0A1Y2KAX1_9PROT|nr:putative DSBA oxidoreductase [Magnetofaba australis IT-1]
MARVGDWTLTLGEVDKTIRGKLYELEKQKFRARINVIQSMMGEHLLKEEAKKQGLSTDALWKQEVTDKAPAISDDEVKAFLDANGARLPNGGKGMEDKVRAFLSDQVAEQASVIYMRQLMSKSGGQVRLQEPEEPRYDIIGPLTEAKGAKSPKVYIVEFSDFECPFCRRVQPALNKLLEEYGDRVQLIFRHFPLSGHKAAPKASEAALCAAEQGKFWEYHDKLFGMEKSLTEESYTAYAKEMKLDMGKFDSCLNSGKKAQRVADDAAEGERLGITGTPAFFINGRKLSGAQPYGEFKRIVEEELAAEEK